MKKIFTLVILAMINAIMLAMPQTNRPLRLQANTTNEQTVALQKIVKSLKRDCTKRVAPIAQMNAQDASSMAGKHTLATQQRASESAITLNGGVFLVEPEYEVETGEWYIAVSAEGYTFRLCWYGSADTFCGTVTMDDISYDYTWGWYQSADLFYQIYLSDVNMTISEQKQSDYLTQIVLDATLIDTNDNTYVLHITYDKYSPKATVESVFENTQLTAGEGNFVLDGNNDKLDVLLTVNSSVIDGVYTQANFDANATQIVYDGVAQTILQANLSISAGYLENGKLGYLTQLSFYNQDTILHTVSMPAALPTPKDTIHVTCTNLVVDESLADYNIISVSGSSDLYDIFAMYEGSYAEAGVYENASIMISDMITWEMVESINSTLTLKETANGWHATIEAYCSDYNWYSIDMQYVVPEPTDTVKIVLKSNTVATYLPYNDNMLQLLNYGAEYEASVTVFGVGLGESFTMDNVYMDYSGIYNVMEGSGVAIADVNGVLDQFGDTTVIKASIIGFDAIQYDVELYYSVPTPVDTVEIEMPVEFINMMDAGYYTLAAYTPDSTWYVSLSPVTRQVAGTFVNDGVFGKFGADDGAYDFYGGNTFVYSQEEWQNYTVEKGSLVVEVAEDGSITAEAKVICSNAIYYHIKMTSMYNTHLDYDEPETAVDRTYTTADNVQIDDQSATSGYIYLALTAADESDMAAFFFYVEEADPDIIIPEGVYPINASAEYGTVQANPGVQGDGVWPSFYAELAEGGLVVPLWLLVDGTVTMTKNDDGTPYLEVDARNSYGVPVHIVYDGSMSDVENVTLDQPNVHKVVKDGQILIIRDDIMYNMMGQEVK